MGLFKLFYWGTTSRTISQDKHSEKWSFWNNDLSFCPASRQHWAVSMTVLPLNWTKPCHHPLVKAQKLHARACSRARSHSFIQMLSCLLLCPRFRLWALTLSSDLDTSVWLPFLQSWKHSVFSSGIWHSVLLYSLRYVLGLCLLLWTRRLQLSSRSQPWPCITHVLLSFLCEDEPKSSPTPLVLESVDLSTIYSLSLFQHLGCSQSQEIFLVVNCFLFFSSWWVGYFLLFFRKNNGEWRGVLVLMQVDLSLLLANSAFFFLDGCRPSGALWGWKGAGKILSSPTLTSHVVSFKSWQLQESPSRRELHLEVWCPRNVSRGDHPTVQVYETLSKVSYLSADSLLLPSEGLYFTCFMANMRTHGWKITATQKLRVNKQRTWSTEDSITHHPWSMRETRVINHHWWLPSSIFFYLLQMG